jgi:intracellular sulfur oxidation DsrE/DsrF family protein
MYLKRKGLQTMMKIQAVFHIDEVAKWDILLTNVQNLIRDIDRTASSVEVVANSKAVEFYRTAANGNFTEIMRRLADAGVSFVACGNALKKFEIQREELLPFVKTVPSGVLELIKCQNKGYAYLKP